MKKTLNPVSSLGALALFALNFAPLAALAQTTAPALSAPAASAPALKPVYNEQADARADLNLALNAANAQHKNVLVVFGANWCGDCRALDRKMGEGQLAAHVAKRLVVLKVDVGRFNRNTDLAAQMGVSLKKGIPAVAVLKNDGEVLRATNGGELADARNMGDEAVLRVLEGLHSKP
ncbi:thiol reductase thioredoxin [Paucibacter sp. KBW04]|uniref:thioredoxin family protein n=1 Tax=Paucibacter sp. KBW04 TaxID=2153361 RepID=UPI000F57A4C2|nr:thioredoxin family protein [Paucibacter sp. KBW04]RQO61850.1 thiol reductase thioredoxin [Paucibacter sp. KBW04]